MIVLVLLVLTSVFMFNQFIRLGSFAVVIMGIAPLQQVLYIFDDQYLFNDLFSNNFIHFRLLYKEISIFLGEKVPLILRLFCSFELCFIDLHSPIYR